MSSNLDSDLQPVSLTERRGSRDGITAQPTLLTDAQRRAYRQLAIVALGLDLPTLTRELRARRFRGMAPLRLLPETDRAA